MNFIRKIILKRFFAFGIDYLIIVLYALLLFWISSLFNPVDFTPLQGQLIGFATLTLPVFLYFYFTEKSKFRATIGKRIMNIIVTNDNSILGRKVFVRNFLKFLPWEIAHLGIHWIVYYSKLKSTPPDWVLIALILPQIIVVGYLISILLYKGQYSLYDKVANTKIGINQQSKLNQHNSVIKY